MKKKLNLPRSSSTPLFNGGKISRRQFLYGATGIATGLALSGAFPSIARAASRIKTLPKPNKSGIEHIIVVTMENRSFDHFFGWLPGANGMQAGLTYFDNSNTPFSTYPLAPDYQGCGHPDPDHSYQGGRIEYDNGACDGWLKDTANDVYCIGYYTQNDLAFLGNA